MREGKLLLALLRQTMDVAGLLAYSIAFWPPDEDAAPKALEPSNMGLGALSCGTFSRFLHIWIPGSKVLHTANRRVMEQAQNFLKWVEVEETSIFKRVRVAWSTAVLLNINEKKVHDIALGLALTARLLGEITARTESLFLPREDAASEPGKKAQQNQPVRRVTIFTTLTFIACASNLIFSPAPSSLVIGVRRLAEPLQIFGLALELERLWQTTNPTERQEWFVLLQVSACPHGPAVRP